jgi:hypothetical protein
LSNGRTPQLHCGSIGSIPVGVNLSPEGLSLEISKREKEIVRSGTRVRDEIIYNIKDIFLFKK